MSHVQEFITMVAPGAQEVQRERGMFASVTIAQAIWETGAGAHVPIDIDTGVNSYNLFGRKARAGEPFVHAHTWEVYNGVREEIVAKFRKFNSYEESVLDRTSFLTAPWYHKACTANNCWDAAAFLIDTGYPGYSYATDPNYVNGITSVIKHYNLTQYDLEKVSDKDMKAIEDLQKQVADLTQTVAKLQPKPIDQQTTDAWAVEPQKFVKDNGISDGTRPDSPVTREEVWTMIFNAIKYITKLFGK